MVQQLRALAALLEDLNLFPSSGGNPVPLCGLHGHCTHVYSQTDVLTQLKIKLNLTINTTKLYKKK